MSTETQHPLVTVPGLAMILIPVLVLAPIASAIYLGRKAFRR